MIHPSLEEAIRCRIYPITKRIAIGQYVTKERAGDLLNQGYTHILNVGQADSIVTRSDGFHQVVDHDVEDLARIPDDVAKQCLDTLNEMLTLDGSKVYLHCIACQNRSPTILWLYFVACGMNDAAARELITQRCPDAVPGHTSLVDDRLVKRVREHGRISFLPVHDPGVLEPAYQ